VAAAEDVGAQAARGASAAAALAERAPELFAERFEVFARACGIP
jgi:hypothetical protein